jgi:hypothetical protein
MAEICEFQNEHIKMLAEHDVKIEKLETKVNDISDMKENLKILTMLQQKQEARDLKFDKNYEDQIKTNAEITAALKGLNNEIKETNNKITSLEGKFYKAESKNLIDVRDVKKEEIRLTLGQKVKKVAIPTGAIAGILTFIYEVVKNIKIGQ